MDGLLRLRNIQCVMTDSTDPGIYSEAALFQYNRRYTAVVKMKYQYTRRKILRFRHYFV